ncbi:MAG: GTPase Era [bacterium]
MGDEQLGKSGFVTLIGRSNVGKSTLMNTLVGTKIAAVTKKPQTTRDVIHGVLNDAQGQAVFVDTPGVLKHKKSAMSGKMLKRVREALQDIDLIIYVVDPSKSLGEEEKYTLSLVRKLDIPKILVINKSDLPEQVKEYLSEYKELDEDFKFIFEVSALKDKHIKPLRKKIFEMLPVGQPSYPHNQITNLSEEQWIAEIIREKVFNTLRQELPYSTHVNVDEIEDHPDIIKIMATIFTSESQYKKMIIGHGGATIKQIGTMARKELEIALNKKIFLKLEVETDKHWVERV